jgi:hypothetical protein
MTKIGVSYQYTLGRRFDIDYYCDQIGEVKLTFLCDLRLTLAALVGTSSK